MKNFLTILGIIAALGLYTHCGNNAAKKEKARQETLKNKEKQAEQEKKQAFQDLLNACLDEKEKIPITHGNLKKEVEKKDVRHLIKQGKIKEDGYKYATFGKRKVENGYVVCISEHFNEREEIMGGTPTKIDDEQLWLIAMNEQGEVTDMLKIYDAITSKPSDERPFWAYNKIIPDKKDFIVEISVGKQDGIEYSGEKIRYKLENGNFKEVSRKKDSAILAD